MIEYFWVEKTPRALVSTDINMDNNMDIIAVNSLNSSISMLLGNGDGRFGDHILYYVAMFQNTINIEHLPIDMELTDVNNDNSTEIIIINKITSQIGVYTLNGTRFNIIDTPVAPTKIIATDINNNNLLI